jgi:capsular polysaccharide transport system permease protein
LALILFRAATPAIMQTTDAFGEAPRRLGITAAAWLGGYPAAPGLGLVDHLGILRALILRDLRLKYRNSVLGFVVGFVQPVVVIIAHYYLFEALKKPMPGDAPIEIFVIGGFTIWFTFSYTVYGLVLSKKGAAGVPIPGVTRMHLRLAGALWQMMSSLVLCLGIAIPMRLIGDPIPFPSVPITVCLFFIAGSLAFGFGLLLESLGHLFPALTPLKKTLIWALFITSGTYFSISEVALPLAQVFWYNPMMHLLEWQRHAFDPGYPVALVTLWYPVGCALGLLFTALVLNRCLRHRLHG